MHLLREDGEEVQQAAWVTRMARKAERELDADWILNDDADELYWPEVGDDLKAALAKVPHRFGRARAAARQLRGPARGRAPVLRPH